MDWNNNGREDLIMGNVYGNLFLFRRTGSGIKDLTGAGKLCYANGDTIDIGSRATPFITDWNNDGKLDMIVGAQGGRVRLFLNTGTASSPSFKEKVDLKNSGSVIKQPNSCPFVVDINKDGKKDLVVASYANSKPARVYYYENKGTDAKPVFNGCEELLDQNGNPIFVGGYLNIWLADWNGDGLLDFLGSTSDGKIVISYAVNTAVSEEASTTVVSSMKISAAVNPARNNFSVRLVNSEEHADITVYDSSGRIAGAKTISDGSELVVIPADGLPAGVYTVVASNGSSVSSCRIVLVD